MFASLEEKDKKIVVDSMDERKFPTGDWVIK